MAHYNSHSLLELTIMDNCGNSRANTRTKTSTELVEVLLLEQKPNGGSTPEREPEKRLPHPRKAAGAQITHSQLGEVVTKITRRFSFEKRYRNEYALHTLTSSNWRASLVPAAAVIPAPIAYIKVAAVKTLVVELWS
ncbi:Cullin-3 [Trichinella spiralis]|uniref:Cullin-3 n=1 Tax=Trichinella spiralis TaxID=6334 RepID=A0ABR3K8F6_TRISP